MKRTFEIKQICKELGLTYKELGEKIGYSFETISKAAQSGNVSTPMQRAIELYQETLELQERLEQSENFKECLKKFLQS